MGHLVELPGTGRCRAGTGEECTFECQGIVPVIAGVALHRPSADASADRHAAAGSQHYD
ncbi:MAG TPA: hypothetical protein VE690_15550 [Rhodopila sp.]|jgi:hypothetical protein|nr:hypothetical protein [Rhodopila sp.]